MQHLSKRPATRKRLARQVDSICDANLYAVAGTALRLGANWESLGHSSLLLLWLAHCLLRCIGLACLAGFGRLMRCGKRRDLRRCSALDVSRLPNSALRIQAALAAKGIVCCKRKCDTQNSLAVTSSKLQLLRPQSSLFVLRNACLLQKPLSIGGKIGSCANWKRSFRAHFAHTKQNWRANAHTKALMSHSARICTAANLDRKKQKAGWRCALLRRTDLHCMKCVVLSCATRANLCVPFSVLCTRQAQAHTKCTLACARPRLCAAVALLGLRALLCGVCMS